MSRPRPIVSIGIMMIPPPSPRRAPRAPAPTAPTRVIATNVSGDMATDPTWVLDRGTTLTRPAGRPLPRGEAERQLSLRARQSSPRGRDKPFPLPLGEG